LLSPPSPQNKKAAEAAFILPRSGYFSAYF
jgi:hypothetical protein